MCWSESRSIAAGEREQDFSNYFYGIRLYGDSKDQ